MAWHGVLYDGQLKPTAQDDRNFVEAALASVGVIDVGDLLVGSGTGMNSSVAAGRGIVRNSFASVQGGLYLIRNDAAASYQHNTADPTNPRIDQIIAKVYDSETGGDSSDAANAVLIPGVATPGATLDNLSGAASLTSYNNYFRLADVLIPNGAASSASFTYRDRRPIATQIPPSIKTSLSVVTFRAFDALPAVWNAGFSSGNGLQQSAYAAFLPRRVPNATRIRWAYTQNSTTAATGNYNIGIYDASGRLIVSTGSVAFTGATGTYQYRSEAIASTTFEAGVYYIVMGWGAIAGSCNFLGVPGLTGTTFMIAAPLPNLFLYSTSGGITMPATILGFTDANVSPTAASGNNPNAIPIVSVSIN